MTDVAGDFAAAASALLAENATLRGYAIFCDKAEDIQPALDLAAATGINRVMLKPSGVYLLNQPLMIPVRVVLDGGSNPYGTGGATLKAATALNPVVDIRTNYSGIVGCRIDGSNLATVGVWVRGNFNSVWDNVLVNFQNATDIAVKCGGAIYPSFKRNQVSACFGTALDAINEYSDPLPRSGYGINAGVSEQNIWQGRHRCLRVEGIFHSIDDRFEVAMNGEYVVETGHIIAGKFTMDNAYFEITRGTSPVLKLIRAVGVTVIRDSIFFGDDSTGSVFLHASSGHLVVENNSVKRCKTGYTGVIGENGVLKISGNSYSGMTLKNDMGIPASARVDALDAPKVGV